MTTDVKLLPMPDELQGRGKSGAIKDYARANMEPLIAENERLREEVGKRNGIDPWAVLIRAQEAEARADRLAEALRHLRNHTSVNSYQIELIDAALRDHDQEVGNG